MTLRDEQKNEVQRATDVVDLVGQHVALKARGKDFLGLCPFHDDKKPSLHVSRAKQIYKCFACGAGGDVFSFVQAYHKMTFPEALKFLAERAGIKLVERGRGEQGHAGPSDRERILDANGRAVGFFRALYRHSEHGQVARDYVHRRKISPEMIEAFQIGYAPDRWDGLVMMIQHEGWDRSTFELAGLVSPRTTGDGHYDRLRHRLIFPICDSIGRPIAFGGRKLREEDEPKYLNSPETPLFNKSSTLFGLHLAKKTISDTKVAVLVEGYTDVIACHQAGVRNVVATLGTALTSQHVSELRRYCEKVVLVYDGDAAGVKATDRAIEVFLTGDLDVAMAILPDEMDPAEIFELSDGLERWHTAVNAATSALDYQFARVKGQIEGAETVTGRQRLSEAYLQRLAQSGLQQMTPLRRAMVIQRLCGLLHLSEQTIQDLLKRLAPVPRRSATAGQPAATTNRVDDGRHSGLAGPENMPSGEVAPARIGNKIKALGQAERYVVGCLLREPGLFHLTLSDGRTLDEALTPGEFLTPQGRRLYERIYQHLGDGQTPTLAELLADLAADSDQELANLVTLADSEVDQSMQGDAQRASQILQAAAQAILAHHREEEYQQARQPLMNHSEAGADLDGSLRLASQLLEKRRANSSPSPIRIARIGT